MRLTEIIDTKTGKVVEVVDADESCNPWAGNDYHGHCGGCGNCILMQAMHWGYETRDYKESEEDIDYSERLGAE